MTDARQPQRTVEAVLRLEGEIMSYIRDKDAKSLGDILTEDFVYRSPESEKSRAEFLSGVAAFTDRILSVEGENLRVSVYGETAVLTGVQHARVRTGDGTEQSGSVAFTDVFVRSRGSWRLALAHAIVLPAPPARQR